MDTKESSQILPKPLKWDTQCVYSDMLDVHDMVRSPTSSVQSLISFLSSSFKMYTSMHTYASDRKKIVLEGSSSKLVSILVIHFIYFCNL